MVAAGLAKAGNLDILNEYKSLQSNLLSIQIQGLEHIISKVKEIQSTLIEEQYLHFHSLLDVYHQAQSSLIDVEEKAKPYEGDNILDDMSCDSNHILKRKEEARSIRDSIMLGCAQVNDPASFMKFVRKELIENREFVSSSQIVSKLSDFNENALVFDENLITNKIEAYKANAVFNVENKPLDDCFILNSNTIGFKTPNYQLEISTNQKEISFSIN